MISLLNQFGFILFIKISKRNQNKIYNDLSILQIFVRKLTIVDRICKDFVKFNANW